VADYWRAVFAEPLQLDIWIGLPHEQNFRVATIYAARAGKSPEPAAFYRDLTKPGTMAHRTFTSPRGLHSISGMNNPAIRAQPVVSFGGIGSGHALAKFYAVLANGGKMDGQTFFTERTLQWMAQTLTDGPDQVFGIPTAFSAGFMKDSHATALRIFGPAANAFGHPGAGGSHAFADPSNKLSFAYVMNQMEQAVLPNDKSLRLVEALYH
jgi:CubicO group peptidase (beta-lactamase class C family)